MTLAYTLTYREVEKLQAEKFPRGSVEEDDDGQIVIYTGLYRGNYDCPHDWVQKVGFSICRLCEEER